MAFFSALSVAIAFLQRVYVTSGSAEDNFVTSLSGVLGIFLLTISLMEWGAANGAKAEALYRNAEDLNAFQRNVALVLAQLRASVPMTWAEVSGLQSEYEAIKARCSANHEPIDDRYFLALKRSAQEFVKPDGTPAMTASEAFLARAIWNLSSVWYFAIFWFAIIVALVCMWRMHSSH